jgi:hypothetical protein
MSSSIFLALLGFQQRAMLTARGWNLMQFQSYAVTGNRAAKAARHVKS